MIALPSSDINSYAKLTIYVDECPSKNFRYDFDSTNIIYKSVENKRPWLTNESDSIWKFEFESIPGSIMWYCESATEYDINLMPFTRAIYADGTVIDTNIVGTLTQNAIEKNNLVSVKIGNNVETIGHDAFLYYSSLTNVSIPDSVTNIDYQAFFACTNLANIVIPGTVKNIDYAAFVGCRNLTNITISEGVSVIIENAF